MNFHKFQTCYKGFKGSMPRREAWLKCANKEEFKDIKDIKSGKNANLPPRENICENFVPPLSPQAKAGGPFRLRALHNTKGDPVKRQALSRGLKEIQLKYEHLGRETSRPRQIQFLGGKIKINENSENKINLLLTEGNVQEWIANNPWKSAAGMAMVMGGLRGTFEPFDVTPENIKQHEIERKLGFLGQGAILGKLISSSLKNKDLTKKLQDTKGNINV